MMVNVLLKPFTHTHIHVYLCSQINSQSNSGIWWPRGESAWKFNFHSNTAYVSATKQRIINLWLFKILEEMSPTLP